MTSPEQRFTDEQVARLKEQCDTWQRAVDDPYFEVSVSPTEIKALLARLEAEKRVADLGVLLHGAKVGQCVLGQCDFCLANEARRKMAGK